MASLKALRNVHYLNDVTAKKLRACALDDGLPTRVRVAALDVFQSDACRVSSVVLKLIFLFHNQNTPTEFILIFLMITSIRTCFTKHYKYMLFIFLLHFN